jgi:hypothetical protein
VKNTLFGENNLGRLQSWNRVKGYLPERVSGYVDKKWVNPAIRQGVSDKLPLLAGAAGSGLLGLYWAYRSLTRPQAEQRDTRDHEKFMAPAAIGPVGHINQRLGLDAYGRAPIQ